MIKRKIAPVEVSANLLSEQLDEVPKVFAYNRGST